MIAGLIEGRIVHYVMKDGQHRPAIVVKIWDHDPNPPAGSAGTSNLQVFADSDAEGKFNDACPPMFWATSVHFDETGQVAGTWHWPEKV